MDEQWTKWVPWAERHVLPVNKNSTVQISKIDGTVIMVHMQDNCDESDDPDTYVSVRLKLPDGVIILNKLDKDVNIKDDA